MKRKWQGNITQQPNEETAAKQPRQGPGTSQEAPGTLPDGPETLEATLSHTARHLELSSLSKARSLILSSHRIQFAAVDG